MSVKAMSWAFEQNLKPYPKLVLLALADHCDHEGVCWPGQSGIAEKTSMSRKAVNQIIQQLAKDGYLTIEHQAREDGGSKANKYRLNMPPPVTHSNTPLSSTVTPPCNPRVTPIEERNRQKEPSEEPSTTTTPTPPRDKPTKPAHEPAQKAGGGGERFKKFWESYPKGRRERKAQCLAVWERLDLEAMGEQILEDVANRHRDYKWRAGYIPSSFTYLAEQRFHDDIQALPPGKQHDPTF